MGWGGVTMVSTATGLARNTIMAGMPDFAIAKPTRMTLSLSGFAFRVAVVSP